MEKLLYSETETREVLGGIGRTKLWELASAGKITPTRIGRRTFYAADELSRFVDSLKGGPAA